MIEIKVPRSFCTFIELLFFNKVDLEFAILTARDVVKGRVFGEKFGTDISNPTANEAIRWADPVGHVVLELRNKAVRVDSPEVWLDILDNLVDKYQDGVKGKLIRRRYIMKETILNTCKDLFIAKTTYYSLLNEVMFFALLLAVERRLVKVDSLEI